MADSSPAPADEAASLLAAWEGPVPRHLAVIMDGNGRWATARGLERVKGHEAGADSVNAIVRACGELGVEVLTLYSFSTENWRRPADEVDALMALLDRYLRTELEELMEKGVQLRAIGQLHRLPDFVREGIDLVTEHTRHNTGLKLVLALSYGGRAELADAVQAIAREVAAGRLAPEAVDEAAIGGHLYTAGLPDPDLLVRTSGELRLSNFLLWQVAYSEMYVTDVLWPDFREPHLLEAFRAFGARERRFGRTGSQLGVPGGRTA